MLLGEELLLRLLVVWRSLGEAADLALEDSEGAWYGEDLAVDQSVEIFERVHDSIGQNFQV